jgi:EAL domain-containing protein (putative c-di-GMP-specific phosphodiesterase class I)
MTVVAEGVENAATRDLLASFGCDEAQGFFFCYPQPPQEVASHLSASRDLLHHAPAPSPVTLAG